NKSAVQPLQAIHAMPLRAIAAAALLLGSASASAQLLQYNWDGSAGTDFLDPENWTAAGFGVAGQVPEEGALANISAAGVAVLDGATHKVATVQVGQAGQGRLQITGGGVLEAARSGTSFGSINIGANAASGGNGGVTVSGVGSRLVAAVDLTV